MISVLINNHNYGRFIGEAIDSVLHQTYQDFELIIVDGASTDDSRAVIMDYVARYPGKITAVFKPTSGQAAAFNVGFKLAKGDIIAFLDSDDYWFPTKLERICARHERYPFIGHARKASDGRRDYFPMDDYRLRPFFLHDYGFIYTYNLTTSCISARREVLQKILPMPEDGYTTYADCYIKCMAQYYSNIRYFDEPLTFYRIHTGNQLNQYDPGKHYSDFVTDLYARIFHDINQKLAERGEAQIPPLTPEGLRVVLPMANPWLDIQQGKTYVLYGAGSNSYKVRYYAELLGATFLCVADTDERKWGKHWEDLSIISPQELLARRQEYDKVLIGATYYKEIGAMLESLGFQKGKDYMSMPIIPND